jgi:signal transduction histidine kinase/HAMP domain-containing protein
MAVKMSIRHKLALILWGFALAAYAIAGVGLAIFQNLTLERRARQAMEPYVQFVAVGADAAVAFEDPVRAKEILDTLRANPLIVNAAIVLKDGRLLAGFGNRSAAAHLPKPYGIHLHGGLAELLQPLPHGARLRLTMKLEQLGNETRRILWFFGAGALVLLAITLGQLAILQRTIITPITSLAEAAESVRTQADYDLHVPAAGDDEVALLGRSFNAMMETIRVRDRDLQELALFNHTIVDSAAYGIVSCDPKGIVTSYNKAAERLLGYRADEIVGRQSPILWHDPEEVAQRARRLSEELGEPIGPDFDVITAHASRGLPDENEWTFIRKDGTRVRILLSVSALNDENGKFTGFVGLVYDLTERKQAEEEIRNLNKGLEQRVAKRTSQLEAANRELEAFAYSVSHDLRAPLRHIDGFIGLLQKHIEPTLDDQCRHYMTSISDSAKKMGQLIDDLLAFSRMGRQAMTYQPVNLGNLVRHVTRELEPDAAGRNIQWRIGELPQVDADGAMLQIVMTNLISNALKFTRPRQQARIEIGWLPGQEAETTIFVRDNGVGFDMAYGDKLFGVFQRLHRTDEFEGTGIGLATVQRIIARHGGRTWAQGELDQGAIFYFSLPKPASSNQSASTSSWMP